MDKETFHNKWYYRLLKVIFWGSLICFSIILILLGYFESDVEVSGLFWAGILAAVYWFFKRLFYFVLFGDPILSKKKEK